LLDLERRGAVFRCDQHQGVAEQVLARGVVDQLALCAPIHPLEVGRDEDIRGAPASICLARADDAAKDKVADLPVFSFQSAAMPSSAFLRLAAAKTTTGLVSVATLADG